MVAWQIRVFTESIFGNACGFKCIAVEAEADAAGLVPLSIATVLSWVAHVVTRRWWKLPGIGDDVNGEDVGYDGEGGGRGGGSSGNGDGDGDDGGRELLLPRVGSGSDLELDQLSNAGEGEYSSKDVQEGIGIGYAENRHRGDTSF